MGSELPRRKLTPSRLERALRLERSVYLLARRQAPTGARSQLADKGEAPLPPRAALMA